MSDRKKAAPGVVGHAKGQEQYSIHPKATRIPRRRASKTAPPSGHLGMKSAAAIVLSAVAQRLDHRATLRCLESVPPSAWPCDLFIDQKAKPGECVILVTKHAGRVGEFATVPLDFLASLLDEIRATRGGVQ